MMRFIPAYAGNASGLGSRTPAGRVHPRIRGERRLRKLSKDDEAGSSPHTRGTLNRVSLMAGSVRFIPAYAGNAGFRPSGPDGHAVHPRIRGERIEAMLLFFFRGGSSPHTRGTLPVAIEPTFNARFIPAYAGNASVFTFRRHWITVHPRIRGERRGTTTGSKSRCGSSPHTRGTPGTGYRVRIRLRFIPAYAGNANLGEGRH